MFNDRHRGAEAPGLLQFRGDARVQAITDLLLEHQALERGSTRLFSDPQRALGLQQFRLNAANPLTYGLVAHALPHLNSYRVQMAYGGGVITCRMASETTCIPLGVRRGSPIPSGSRVLVWKDPTDDVGTILCVLPYQLEDSRLAVPGYLVQGSATGLKREAAHRAVIQMFRQGGAQDFSCQAPLDATSQEWSRVSETGTAVLLSAMEAVLKVNELCGLFLSYWDSHGLLAALNFDLSTAVQECRHRHDEGEHRLDSHIVVYPWEGVGSYTPGGGIDMAVEIADKEVQYSSHKGKVDLAGGVEDTQPFYRVQSYGGYTGQGGLTQVCVPPSSSGRRRLADSAEDIGVAADFTGLDGTRVIQSAKALVLLKRCQIEIAREVKLPEDAAGDDATADNYRFSGSFGSGVAHQVNDFTVPSVPGVSQSLLRVAGVQDLLARVTNWQRLHPFHYHSRDYRTPQASADPVFPRTQESLDFDVLKSSGYLADPVPVLLAIDHRYNSVAYFMRESFLAFHDDGSITLAGGGGERLSFSNGKVRLEAPGNVEILAGCQALTVANEVILKSQGSVDISSSRQDVRLRALHNLHMEGEDNVLIEAKSADARQNYQDRIGEDVSAGGIVFKSRSAIGLLADEIYLRSGVGVNSRGDIVLDAGSMTSDVVISAATVRHFLAGEGVEIWCATSPGNVFQRSHFFGLVCAHHHTSLTVTGDMTVGSCDDDGAVLMVNGAVNVTTNVGAGGQIASGSGGMRKVARDFVSSVLATMAEQCIQVVAFTTAGTAAYDSVFSTHWYVSPYLGHDATIGFVGFSYRDPDSAGAQYHTQQLVFEEPRWQQLVRAGGGTGGAVWQEHPVSYQGRQLYPWPGRQKWLTDLTFAQSSPLLYDWASGHDEDRPSNYETPTLPTPALVTMASAFKVIQQL